jgi:hypothetical protein
VWGGIDDKDTAVGCVAGCWCVVWCGLLDIRTEEVPLRNTGHMRDLVQLYGRLLDEALVRSSIEPLFVSLSAKIRCQNENLVSSRSNSNLQNYVTCDVRRKNVAKYFNAVASG